MCAFKTDLPNPDMFQDTDRTVRKEIQTLVDDIVTAVDNQKAAEQVVSDLKDELRGFAREVYWETNYMADLPVVHTFDARGKDNTVQINFLNKYDLDAEKLLKVAQLLGKGNDLVQYLQEKTIVNVDVSALPKAEMIEFFKKCSALCKEYGVQGFVDDKYVVAPEFHDERHELTPEENQAIDEILPVQVHITT